MTKLTWTDREVELLRRAVKFAHVHNDVQYKEIADSTGLKKQTVTPFANGKTGRPADATLAALWGWAEEGGWLERARQAGPALRSADFEAQSFDERRRLMAWLRWMHDLLDIDMLPDLEWPRRSASRAEPTVKGGGLGGPPADPPPADRGEMYL